MLKQFLSLFLKVNCPICQRSADDIICHYCAENLLSCRLDNPQQFWQNEIPLFVWGKYDGYLKRAIAKCKYDLKPEIGELLGQYLGEAWLQANFQQKYPQLTIMPIPLHEKKLKERGFNQAELITRQFCQVTGYQQLPDLLKRVKNTEAMFELTPNQRIANLKQAFSVGKDYGKLNRNSPILIVDDIHTTGTTVKEAIAVLNKLQIKILGVAVIAMPRI